MSTYDYANHKWSGQCPHGDVCSGCDEFGYCTKMESRSAPESRVVEALREAVAGQAPSQVQGGRVYLIDAEVIDALINVRFQCPACGKSFVVSSETSQRIYCGSACHALSTEAALERTTPESPGPVPETQP